MNILLIQPPIRDFYRTRFREYPLGLLYCAAALEAAGHEAHILDARWCARPRRVTLPPELSSLAAYYTRENNLFIDYQHFGMAFEAITAEVAQRAPDIVGISSMFTPYVQEAIATAHAVKAALPQCPVVMGGVHATVDPASIMESGAVDSVVRGEGEELLPEIVADSKIHRGSSPLLYKEGKGEVEIEASPYPT